MRPQRVVQAAFSLGRGLALHPLEFCKYVARQAVAFDSSREASRGGFTRTVTAAIDDRTRTFLDSPPATLLPQRDLAELFEPVDTEIGRQSDGGDSSELPDREQRAIVRMVTALAPSTVFEIGTYRGRTTKLLATCSPRGIVHTLDLAPDRMLDGGCFHKLDKNLIGARFSGDRQVHSRIIQHFGDSREFDFRPFHNNVDLVFVDASHAYEAVQNDSAAAFLMIRPGGVIVWDDYHPVTGPGVMRALAQLSATKPLTWIRGTRLVVHQSPPARPGFSTG